MDDKIAKVMGFANFGKKGDGAKKRGGDSFSKGMMGVIGKKATKGADAKLSKEIERRVEVAEEMDKQAVKNAHLTEEALGSETGAALPVTHTAVLRARDKAVTALAIDGTGSRLIMGGMDFKVSMFHFAGMDSRLLPFKEHEPHEGYPVNDLSYSPSSDRYVASVSYQRPLIFDREGNEKAEFANGDMYVVQEQKTKGHTARTSTARWFSDDSQTIITSSADGTVRLWDVERVDKRQREVFVHGARNTGKKPAATYADLNGAKSAIISTGADGRVCVWPRAGPYNKPSLQFQAHAVNTTITSAATSAEGRYIATRGTDDTVKLWDVRNISRSVAERGGLEAYFDNTSIIFGHGDNVIATGTGADPRKGEKGRLVLMNAQTLEPLADLPVGTGSVCRIAWPSMLNQIFVTSQDGGCHIFYNPITSMKGALLAVNKHKKYDGTECQSGGQVFSLSSAKDVKEAYQQAQAKRTSTKTHQKAPTSRPDAAGPPPPGAMKPLSAHAAFLQEYMPQTVAKKHMKTDDPRTALASVAEEATQNPRFVDNVYAAQPKIFAENDEDGDDDDVDPKAKKRKT